jgi:fermentation-respiration switch protein FrsA (DUF1100 family)
MTATVVLAVAGGYLLVVALAYSFQRNLLFLPDLSVSTPAESGLPEMATVTLPTADGLALASWYRPATSGERHTIVYFHGNGGHVGYRGPRVRPYLDAGHGVLLVEYRGYGGNPGKPTEAGLYEDGRAALGFLAAAGVPAERTVLYGESLGTAVAVHVARQQAERRAPVAAVVLEAPLSSAVDVGAYHYPLLPVRLLMKDRFDSKAKIAAIAAPLLIVHGENDRVVPIEFGRAVFAAAAEPKRAVWIADAGHEDLGRFGLQETVMRFLETRSGGEGDGGRQGPAAGRTP